MLDICYRCDINNKIDYVWFDTGLEYKATKDHIKYLEMKYGIEIKKYKAKRPIPLVCKEYGQPFISKRVSDMIQRLQRYNFEFNDKSFEELYKEYPKCKSALLWWCNEWGTGSQFNIQRNVHLKSYIINNPPKFKIANMCCKFAKKDVAHDCIKQGNYDLNIYGVRKAEGGARASAYKTCFTDKDSSADEYRPLLWYKDSDKIEYENHFGVTHSACYTMYGLKRTGCCGCPFGQKFEEELETIRKYEPKLYKAICNIFGNSYEYMREFKKYKQELKNSKDESKV